MTKTLTTGGLALTLLLAVSQVSAKLPALSDEAKAKAAEAAAKTGHSNKVADFQLCKSMDKVAVAYYANAKKAGTVTTPPAATPPCADPGVFVYTPPAPAAPAATAPAAPAAPAAAAAVAVTAPAAPKK